MLVVTTLIEVLYVLALFGLAVYGVNSVVNIALFEWKKGKPMQPNPLPDWPSVTVQLPTYNERYMVERLLNAVTALDYPREKLQIQMLDDSTDETAVLVRRIVAKYIARGHNIELIQRKDRSGFKAGALAEGLKTATGDLVAIFDADFIPSPDWLKKTVIYFGDPKLACMQTRWGHLNSGTDLFAHAQSLGIDGHFIVEQTARSRNSLFLNFNGTAGIWRRTAIEDAGGWQPDTLCEDLDLSYRVQMHGWHIGYTPEVVVKAELPAQVEAFKKQQFRWAKGSFQVVRKTLGNLWRAPITIAQRVMGTIHLLAYIVHPLMLVTLLLMLPIGLLDPKFLKMFPWTMITAFGPPLVYLCAKTEFTPRLIDRLKLIPALVMIGFGLSVNNTLAVLQGLFSKDMGSFVRTPKFDLTATRASNWQGKPYVMSISPLISVELGLAIYAILSIILLLPSQGLGTMPLLLVYAISYSYMAGLNLVQNWQSSQVRRASNPSEA
ncbi:glycosyltransferase [Longilinea arvoryzae]|uniref:Glycosyltransferase n=1 Tax=Longilinea arvoryzae TaxID=360412 RepID=A0A0S7BDC7_9CHLR|nr:glycosyltransferase [Longilinea arvoryzae]GAP12451.1 glycosyltransferase [Longilinea arvoryzae]